MARSLPLQLGVSKATSKASASTATSSGTSIEANSDVAAFPDLRGLLEKYDVDTSSSRPLSLPAAHTLANELLLRLQKSLLVMDEKEPFLVSSDGEMASIKSLEKSGQLQKAVATKDTDGSRPEDVDESQSGSNNYATSQARLEQPTASQVQLDESAAHEGDKSTLENLVILEASNTDIYKLIISHNTTLCPSPDAGATSPMTSSAAGANMEGKDYTDEGSEYGNTGSMTQEYTKPEEEMDAANQSKAEPDHQETCHVETRRKEDPETECGAQETADVENQEQIKSEPREASDYKNQVGNDSESGEETDPEPQKKIKGGYECKPQSSIQNELVLTLEAPFPQELQENTQMNSKLHISPELESSPTQNHDDPPLPSNAASSSTHLPLIQPTASPSDPPLSSNPTASPILPSSPELLSLKPMSDLASPTEQQYSIETDKLPSLPSPELDSGYPGPRRSSADPTQQYRELHKPFSFPSFVAQLANKEAAPIARYIRSFLVAFWKQGHTFTAEQRVKVVKDFEVFIHEKFTLHEPFASMDALDLENSREGLEKLVMNRVHGLCFPPVVASDGAAIPRSYSRDLELDEQFAVQLDKYSWVNGAHLDVADLEYQEPRLGPTLQDGAAVELNKMNKYKAPRDKIICILNACKLIVLTLRKQLHSTNADAFIPLLILVIFKAKCDYLITNLHYIENFRGDEWLGHGETSYYLASLQGAISFIQGLDESSLTITPEEYHAHMEAWDAQTIQSHAVPPRTRKNETSICGEQVANPAQIGGRVHRSFEKEISTTLAGLSPSNVILSSAEMFTKSISDFLTPSPPIVQEIQSQQQPQSQPQPALAVHSTPLDPSRTHQTTYRSLREMFPTIDRDIIKDILYMHNGEISACVDGCLQLTTNE